MKTYKDLNMALMSAYTLVNWLITNYDQTKAQTKLNIWQYPHTKEWNISVNIIAETNITLPIELTNITSKSEWTKFESNGKELTSTTYKFETALWENEKEAKTV